MKLTQHLANLGPKTNWQARFDELEQILGFPLPASARSYYAWWANQGRGQSLSWQGAGWKATEVDLDNERVKFVYVSGPESANADYGSPMTIADAKVGLATAFGVTVDAIEITIRG